MTEAVGLHREPLDTNLATEGLGRGSCFPEASSRGQGLVWDFPGVCTMKLPPPGNAQNTPSVPGQQRGLATPLIHPGQSLKVLSCASKQISPLPPLAVGVSQLCPQGWGDTTSVRVQPNTLCIQSKVHSGLSWTQANETRHSMENRKGQALLAPTGPQSHTYFLCAIFSPLCAPP